MMTASVIIADTSVWIFPIMASLQTTDENYSFGRIVTSCRIIELTKEFLEYNDVKYTKIILLAPALFAKKSLIHEDDKLTYCPGKCYTLLVNDPPRRKYHKRSRHSKYGKRFILKNSELKNEIKMIIYGKWHTMHYKYRPVNE